LPGKKIVHVYDVRPLFETALMNPHSSPVSKLMARLDLLGLRSAHLLCTPSQSILADLTDIGIDSKKVRIVPMGMDRSVFNAQANPTDEPTEGVGPFASEQFILYVGSVAPKKNLEVLIRGLGLLVHRSFYPRLKLAIIGPKSDDETERIRKVARESDVDQRLLLFGSLPQTVLARVYNLAAVYVQPSTYEGFCLTVLEAAACGTPVVASSIRGNVDALGDCALYFDPSSPEELSKQLDAVLRDPARRADLARRGQERTAFLSWEATGQRLLKMCTSVTDHGAS
jgi:glycosyltransferase involved in cell wall biosynthesis